MINTRQQDIVSQIHPINVGTIWNRGDYSAFYQSASGNFLDIAVRFWKNNGELVAHVGTAVHRIVDGVEYDTVMSVMLHSDGRLTKVGDDGRIIQGYLSLITFRLLLNPACYLEWIQIDKESAVENLRHVAEDIDRDSFAASMGMRSLPPLEETPWFEQLRASMDRLQGAYSDISNQ